jgi:hypothetical protein
LFRLRNYFGAIAVHLGLRDAKKYPQLTLIFNDMVDSTDNYKFYRQRWHETPGLPFIYPHTHGLYPERKAADFFRFREYVKWRSDGNVDDLTSYFNPQTSSSPPVDRGWWPDLFTELRSQLQQLFSCFSFTDQLVTASNPRHFDPEKGLQVNTRDNTATRISGETGLRPLSAMVLDLVVRFFSTEAYKEWASAFKSHCSKRACFSVPRQRGLAVWRLLPSLCLCGSSDRKSLCSDSEDKAYLSGPVNARDSRTPSRTNSSLSLNQLPAMGSSVDYFVSSLEGTIHSILYSADSEPSYPSVNTCSSGSFNARDKLSLSLSSDRLPPNLRPGTWPEREDSLETSISSMETWVKEVLSKPSETNDCYIPLLLMQGPAQNRSVFAETLSRRWSPTFDTIWTSLSSKSKAAHPTSLDKARDVMRHIDPPVPHLPIMDPQWSPPGSDSNMTAEDVAATTDATFSYPFHLVPFPVFGRGACGHPSELVNDVLDGISHAYHKLRQLFTEQPKQRALYEDAKKVFPVPTGSIWHVNSSLDDAAPRLCCGRVQQPHGP